MDGSFEGEGRRYALYVIVALVVVGFGAAAWASVQRARDEEGVLRPSSEAATGASAQPDGTEGPTAVPASETADPSASPSPAASISPSPSSSPTATAGEEGTVLFEGGPARGPWQQLGTVAEITHPGAPTSARYSYANFWSDPAEENQPDELWDRIVIEVTDQLVELGDPVDRPVFGGAEGSEPFNSFGGVQDVYPEEELVSAQWNAAVETPEGVSQVFFWYLVSFEGEIVERGDPVPIAEEGAGQFSEVLEGNVEGMRAWAAERGATSCFAC